MAKVSFRQGIVQAFQGSDTFIQTNGNYVQLNAQTANPVQIAIVDGPKDYLFTEFTTRPTAWGPFTDNKDRWLYWDINRITGVRTFGHTEKEPVVQATAPPSPTTGQMWFDTNNNVWKEYTGSSWRVVLRVFAAKFSQSSTFESVSARAGSGQFTGTQVGITTPTRAGSIVFDTLGNPIIDQNGRFFTTEDDFITGIPTGTKLRISNIVKTAQAREPLAPFQVVQLDGVDQVKPATVSEQGRKVLGIVDTGVGTGDQIDFTTEGIVFNEQWDWFGQGLTANDPVYINNTGVITKTPQSTEQVPIGVVLDAQTIIFAPRLFPQIETQGDVPLEDLTQSGATDNQAIVWNDSVGQWEPSIRDLDSLDDVNIGTVTDQHVLTYDSSSGVWVNQTISGAGIAPKGHTHDATDVVTGQFADARISQSSVIQHEDSLSIDTTQLTQGSAASGNFLYWDGSSWIARTTSINDLSDVETIVETRFGTDTPSDGDFLIYVEDEEAGTALWKNLSPANAIPSVDSIGNVEELTAADGDVLAWDDANSVWTASSAASSTFFEVKQIDDTSYTLQLDDSAKWLVFTASNTITVTLPEQSTTALPEGFYVYIKQTGTGRVGLTTQGSDILNNIDGHNGSEGQHAWLRVLLQDPGSPNTWDLDGRTGNVSI